MFYVRVCVCVYVMFKIEIVFIKSVIFVRREGKDSKEGIF